MPSSYSSRFRLNFQAPGDNLNTWGTELNTGVFQLLEDAIARRVAFSLSGAKTLTTANGATDEGRCAYLDVTGGTGGTITAPAVEKLYVVRNGASGDVVVTTGGGSTATVKPGEILLVACDAANFRRAQFTDMGGARLTGLADPSDAQDAATRGYVDGLAFGGAELPGQAGNAGKFLTTNGSTASWGDLKLSSFSSASSGAIYAKSTGGSLLGGVGASTAGVVHLLSGAGSVRLQTDSNGTVTTYSDGGAARTVAFTEAPTFTGGLTIFGATKNNVKLIESVNIDLSQAEFFYKSIDSNTSFNFENAIASRGMAFLLELTISSGAIPSWPAAVDYPGGVNPSANLGNGKHTLGFITFNGGIDWLMIVVARAQA